MASRVYPETTGVRGSKRPEFEEVEVCWNRRRKFATYLPHDSLRFVTTSRLAEMQGQPDHRETQEFQEDANHLKRRLTHYQGLIEDLSIARDAILGMVQTGFVKTDFPIKNYLTLMNAVFYQAIKDARSLD